MSDLSRYMPLIYWVICPNKLPPSLIWWVLECIRHGIRLNPLSSMTPIHTISQIGRLRRGPTVYLSSWSGWLLCLCYINFHSVWPLWKNFLERFNFCFQSLMIRLFFASVNRVACESLTLFQQCINMNWFTKKQPKLLSKNALIG